MDGEVPDFLIDQPVRGMPDLHLESSNRLLEVLTILSIDCPGRHAHLVEEDLELDHHRADSFRKSAAIVIGRGDIFCRLSDRGKRAA